MSTNLPSTPPVRFTVPFRGVSAFRHSALLLLAATALAAAPSALRAQTDVIFAESFQPVQAEGWNAMSWNLGAAAGVVPTTQFWPGSYAYTLYAYGGGAAGWAQYNTPLLAGKSAWTYQAKAKYVQSVKDGTPQPGWYGEGGLLISSGEGQSGNWIWVGWNNAIGEFDSNTSWAQPIIYWNLGGQSGGGIQWGPGMRSFRQGDPFTLKIERSGSTITLTIDTPVDGQRVEIKEFTGDAAAALDTLQYIGFINYFSQWEYDDVSVSDADGEIYANDFENGGQPGWNTTSVGSYWWDRGDTGGTNGLFAFRNESTGGGAAGWAVYTAPVLTNTSTNWSYSGLAKWTASHNPGVPYYGNGYLLLAAATNIGAATDFVSVGFTRGDYDGTGNSWAFPFYEYRLNGTYASGAFTVGGAFRDFTDSPPINIKVSRSAGSSDLTFVIDTPLDGSRTNTLSFTGEEAAALDGLQYVGLMNYYSTFQFSDLQVTTSGDLAPPSALAYTPSSQTATVGTAIVGMIPSVTGSVDGYSISPALPSGLVLDGLTGTISGTPAAVSAATTYTVTASNAAGSTTAEVNLGVQSAYAAWAQGAPLDPANQLLYAIGGASGPTATNGVASVTTVNSNTLSITAIVRTNDPSLAVFGESTLNLAVGPWITNDVSMTPAVEQDGVPSGTQRQIFSTPRATNDTKKFLRLRTTLSQ
jgi:hypothetical protein